MVLALNLPGLLIEVIAIATPGWTAAILVFGLPAAAWTERRMPADASFTRRYGVYAGIGVAAAVPVALVALIVPLGGAVRWP